MKVADVAQVLKPFKLALAGPALAQAQHSIALEAGAVRAASGWARLTAKIETGLAEPIVVNGPPFFAVIDSLPTDGDVALQVETGALAWQCGAARGRLATIPDLEIASVNGKRATLDAWKPPGEFSTALELGALSCGGQVLSTVGLFGVVLDARDARLWVRASDNITVSAAAVDKPSCALPELITLSPDGASLLATLAKRGGRLSFDDTTISYSDGTLRAVINQLPPLQHDLRGVLGNYDASNVVAPIPPARIAAFIKRAAALAETKGRYYVQIAASHGQLSLRFEQGLASSDEYYLVDGLTVPDLQAVALDALKLARALAHIDEVVLDHIDRQVLVLRGSKPTFRYLIAGKG